MAVASVCLALSVRYLLDFRWREIGRTLSRMNWHWLLVGGATCVLPYWFMRTLRLKLILRHAGVESRLQDLYLPNVVFATFALMTPFHAGEALKIESLRRQGIVGRSAGYGAFVFERLLDLCVVILIAVICLLLTARPGPGRWVGPIAVALFALSVPALGAVMRRVASWARLAPSLQQIAAVAQPARLLPLAFLTGCGWLFVTLGWMASLRAIGVDLSLLQGMSLVSGMTLVNVLSFVPGAIGVSEVGTAAVLARFGYEPAAAQAGAIAVRMFTLVVFGLAAVHLLWAMVRYKLNRRLDRANIHPGAPPKG